MRGTVVSSDRMTPVRMEIGGVMMGQHKHNPTAIAAKNGELPPKPKPMGKRDTERLLIRKIERITGAYRIRQMIPWNGYEGLR